MSEETNFDAVRSLLRRALKELTKGNHEKKETEFTNTPEGPMSTYEEVLVIVIESTRSMQNEHKQSKEFI